MPTPNVLQHTITAELRYQLVQTALDLEQAEGGHDKMILTEQYDTICRFLENPHAIPVTYNVIPRRGSGRRAAWVTP